MCLLIDDKVTIRTQNRLNKAHQIRCWKVVRISFHGTRLTAPVYFQDYEIGWNQSNRLNNGMDTGEDIGRGFHVFLTRKGAVDYCELSEKVIPVTCYAKNFIGAGYGGYERTFTQAVFTRMYIDPKTYEKAVA